MLNNGKDFVINIPPRVSFQDSPAIDVGGPLKDLYETFLNVFHNLLFKDENLMQLRSYLQTNLQNDLLFDYGRFLGFIYYIKHFKSHLYMYPSFKNFVMRKYKEISPHWFLYGVGLLKINYYHNNTEFLEQITNITNYVQVDSHDLAYF